MGRYRDVVERHVRADPMRCWELVSDVTNMGRWSPETFRARWLGGATGPVPGARFRGWNRRGPWVWFTDCEVEDAEPGRVFTFSTRFLGRPTTRWSYAFTPQAGGTRIRESRTVVSIFRPVHWLDRVLMPDHYETFDVGMRATLERLAAGAEGRAAAPGH